MNFRYYRSRIFLILLFFGSQIICLWGQQKTVSIKSSIVKKGIILNSEDDLSFYYSMDVVSKGGDVLSAGYYTPNNGKVTHTFKFVIYHSNDGKTWEDVTTIDLSDHFYIEETWANDPHAIQRMFGRKPNCRLSSPRVSHLLVNDLADVIPFAALESGS